MQYAFLVVAVSHAFIASPPLRRPLHLRSTTDDETTTFELVAKVQPSTPASLAVTNGAAVGNIAAAPRMWPQNKAQQPVCARMR